MVIWSAVVLAGVIGWYAYDLPNVQEAAARPRPASMVVQAVDGTPLAAVGPIHGDPVSVATLPPILVRAVLATEDRRFHHHFGVDPIGVTRAIIVNVTQGRFVQGGSTITQQVAKNLFLTHARTLRRKVQEVLLALWLEHTFTKEQILDLYLNRVYLGAGTYGMDAAARRYFRRPATQVTPYQAAVLAGLMKAPSRLNPATSPDRAHARAREVLGNLVETGDLDAAQAARIAREGRSDLALARGRGSGGRYFAGWVMDRVDGHVGTPGRDLVVETTLRPAVQHAAEQALSTVLEREGRARGATQGAVVVLDPGGAVLAMVGGRDFRASQFNRAAQARRQPGSAFKPVVFLAGLEAGLRPDTVIPDAPVRVRGWAPENHDGRFRGPISLTEALAHSVNTVAVRVAETAGRARVARVARRLGLTEVDTEDPSLALGTTEVSPLNLTAAYAAIANGGTAAFPHGITRILDREGRVLYRRQASGTPPRVMAPGHAADLRAMLRAVVTGGTGRAAQPRGPGLIAAGKTGTTQAFRDAWFVGFVQDTTDGGLAVAGVWMGDDRARAMDGVTGGTLPAAVFKALFESWRP
ncbi:PBP1A family penicillin-binding protein [Roseospira visakhapatnamensis]|uniref:Penicillin-binding protein 1A n=1 Tax=Roseospira visakhapatnamensis TaxID=390880 RepID=A0A7W6RF66_9PROT|nr:penicillin-binding protein 1A [Roseospira visakhapatnamensis]